MHTILGRLKLKAATSQPFSVTREDLPWLHTHSILVYAHTPHTHACTHRYNKHPAKRKKIVCTFANIVPMKITADTHTVHHMHWNRDQPLHNTKVMIYTLSSTVYRISVKQHLHFHDLTTYCNGRCEGTVGPTMYTMRDLPDIWSV